MSKKKRYRVLAPYLRWGTTIAYRDEVRDDIPAESLGWLQEQGYIDIATDGETGHSEAVKSTEGTSEEGGSAPWQE